MRKGWATAAAALLVSACLSSADLSSGGTGGAGPIASPEAGTCTADLQSDVGNCGACGKVCGNQANAYGYCKAGACAIGCNTGFGDCDGKADNGCEATLATDSNNCGSCGKSCGGARCVAGQCQPLSIADIPGYVTAVGQDTTDIYYAFTGGSSNYAVGRLAKDGSKGHTVVITGLTSGPPSLEVSDTDVYWTKVNSAPSTATPDGGIFRDPKATASAAGPAWLGPIRDDYNDNLVLAEGAAFYATYDTVSSQTTSVISRAPQSGATGTGTAVAQSIKGYVYALAVDGSMAYFFASGDNTAVGRGLYQCATSGCGTSSVAVAGMPANTLARQIVSLGPYLYLSTGRAVVRVKKDGSAYEVLGAGDQYDSQVISFATDGTTLYWIEDVFTGGPSDEYYVWGCPVASCKDGRAPVVVPGRPRWVLADANNFFFVTATNPVSGQQTTVMKVVK